MIMYPNLYPNYVFAFLSKTKQIKVKPLDNGFNQLERSIKWKQHWRKTAGRLEVNSVVPLLKRFVYLKHKHLYNS